MYAALARIVADGSGVSHVELLTLIVALFGTAMGSPVLVAWVQSRQMKRGRIEDKVARSEVAAALHETNATTTRSLNQIHVLVNSNLLDVQRRELHASRLALQAMHEAIAVKDSAGIPVLPETRAAISRLEHQIEALSREMKLRIDQEANGLLNTEDV